MAARANVTLTDGENTPVGHVFTPDGVEPLNPAVSRFINKNATLLSASELLTATLTKSTSSADDINRPGVKVKPDVVEFRLSYPRTYTEAVSGLTLIDYTSQLIMRSLMHPRETIQRRENLRVMGSYVMGATSASWIGKLHDELEFLW